MKIIDLTKNNNYSYDTIVSELCIPLYQQMIVADSIEIKNNIDLMGTLVII